MAPIGKSDHQVLLFDIHCYVQFNEPQIRFAYDRGDYISAADFLSNCSWDGDDASSMWDSCMSNLSQCRDNFIPTFKTSNRPVWERKGDAPLDSSTRKLISEKTRAFNLSFEHRNQPDANAYRIKYNRARNKVTGRLRHCKRKHEKGIVDEAKSNPKRFWAYCQSKTRSRVQALLLFSVTS